MISSVVLFATAASGAGRPPAALAWEDTTLAARLAAQIAALGAADVHVVARRGAAALLKPSLDRLGTPVALHESPDRVADLRLVAAAARDSPAGTVSLAYADIVTQPGVLAGVLLSPGGSGVLASRGREKGTRIRTEAGRVMGAASDFHRVEHPDALALGVVKVAHADRAALADVAERLAELAPGANGDDVVALVLVGLVRSGVFVAPAWLQRLFWARPLTPEDVAQARERITTFDEDAALLAASVKANDGFFTTFFVSPYSRYIARWAARRGWTPNGVTVLSLGVGVVAAAAFATGDRWGLVAGALLLQAAFTLDCVDGQLARYTRTFSDFGAWLDSMFDRTKEYLVYAGLAIGAAAAGNPVWALAGGALALQTTRHMLDLAIPVARQRARSARVARVSLEAATDRGRSAPSRAVATGWWSWVKRIVGFPIGERFAAISITAAVSGAELTFVVLLAWCAVGTVYLLAGMVKA